MLNHFFNLTHELFCIANKNGYFIELNKAWEVVLGYTLEELTSRQYIDFVHPDDIEKTREAIAGLASGKKLASFVNRYLCKDGTYLWIEWSAGLAGDLIYGIAWDITERKATEKALKERLEFETFLADLSARFVNIPPEQVDWEIDEALRTICEHLDIDIANLWQLSGTESNILTLNNFYRYPEGPPPPMHINAEDVFPWCLREVRANKIIAVSTDEAPPEAARDLEMWRYFGIKSTLVFPLFSGRIHLIGALAFAMMREKHSWSDELVKRLHLLAQVFTNVLVRRQSERALRESEERLNLASASVGIGFWMLDLTTNQFWATPQALRLFGLAPDYALNLDNFLKLVYHEDREHIIQAVNQISQSNDDIRIQYRVLLGDNSIRWMASQGRGQLGSSGKVERLIGASWDITERVRTETAAAEIQSMITTVMESTDDMIWSVDSVRFGLLTFNPALKDYFLRDIGLTITKGMSPEDLVAGPFTPEVATKWCEFYKRALREGPYSVEYQTSARTKILYLSFSLLKRNQEIFGVSVFAKDITEYRRAEADAHVLQMELLRIERMAHLGELIASLSHELNQPLAAILSSTQAVIRFLQASPPDLNLVNTILKNVVDDDKRAAGVITSLRSLVKKEEGEKEPLNIIKVLGDVLTLFRSEAIIRDMKITTDFESPLPIIHGDRIQLQQVILNLVKNAMEAMEELPHGQRKIILKTRATDHGVHVMVHDCGHGIDPARLDKIWEPFYTTKKGGLGIGLRLSRSIISAHGGHIWAENNPDGGATFAFEIPAIAEEKGQKSGI